MHVLLRQEGSVYTAQCVEYDIAAEGESVEAAKRAFGHAIIRHVLAARQLGRAVFADVPPAGEQVRQMWDATIEGGAQPERLTIPAFTIRQRSEPGAATSEAAPVAEAELVCL